MSKDLTRALKRLEKSNTRLTRRRARQALRSATEAILKGFPPLDDEGRICTKKTVPNCPLCKIPIKSWTVMVGHLFARHWTKHGGFSCPGCKKKCDTNKRLRLHLAAVHRAGDLHEHIVIGATYSTFSEKE